MPVDLERPLSIRRNTALNVAGSVFPVLVSLMTVPLYLHRIGDARYGVMAIIWLFVGYSGLFDFGLSRATSNQIAKLSDGPVQKRQEVFWNALILNSVIGALGGLIVYFAAHAAFRSVFKIPVELRQEALPAVGWIGIAVPLSTISGVLTGTLEGRSRFGILNVIQAAGAVLTQFVPLIVSYLHGPQLGWLIPAAILSRGVSTVPLVWAAGRSVPISKPRLPSRRIAKQLFGYGAWVAVTNFISPILETADRLIIGGIVGAANLAYYTIPFNLATKVSIMPAALARTIFPLLSYEQADGAGKLATKSVLALIAVLTPIIVIGIIIMRPFLTLWLGAESASHSYAVGVIILAGVWMNSLAFVPFAQLQGQSRPDIVAKFHLAELLPFLVLLWIGLKYYGIEGAAIAWSVRAGADAILLFAAAGNARQLMRVLWLPVLELAGSCIVAFVLPIPTFGGIAVGMMIVIVALWGAVRRGSPLRELAPRVVFGRAGADKEK